MRRACWSVAFLMWSAVGLRAQTVTTTVPAGTKPQAVAVNPVTNTAPLLCRPAAG
jgi:hypothetical protein